MNTNLEKEHFQGSHRQCSPIETFNKISPMMQAMGITRVANITGLDHIGIPVVTVCRPQSCAVSVAQGKGLDLISAKVSGVMEAIETYHGEHIELPLRLASYNQLKAKHQVVDVSQLAKSSFSEFSLDLPILWIESTDLISNSALFVPYEMVHCNFSLPLPAGSGYFLMSTNGLASGNNYLEAVSHGLSEVIERDAMSLWHTERAIGNNMGQRQVDLSTITDKNCLGILAQFKAASIAVGVWDITSDLGIATFYCMISDDQHSSSRTLYPSAGSGTHPCKSIALLRALTEAAQTRLTLISGSRDDVSANEYLEKQNVDFQNEILNQLNQLNGASAMLDYANIKSWDNNSFSADIALITAKLAEAGLTQIAVVGLTKDEFGIAVVRVVVPGLEGIHDMPGFIAGHRMVELSRKLSKGIS